MSEHQKWYFNRPSIPDTLENGWIFSRDTSQYSYNLNGALKIKSSIINHALLGITFYQFGLQTGEKFTGDVPVSTAHIPNWLRGMLSMGNKLQGKFLGRHTAPSSTDEALDILKFTCDLKNFSWSHVTEVIKSKNTPTFENHVSLVNSGHGDGAIRNYLLKLAPSKHESLLFCQKDKSVVFLPTEDNHILLIDAHSHTHMNGGALILRSQQRAVDIDDMLMDYFHDCVRPKPTTILGQAFILCCPPHYSVCEIPG